ncbi:MAG: hypothetical protein GXO26_03175 [Crenarchaeota archaeon]|nr:hypothetical protein [Thermoproteota archaeon]
MTILSVKENLYTFIVKNGKVDSTRLVKWSRENGIGILILALTLNELEKERKIKVLDKRVIGKFQIDGKEIIIELPTLVEPAQVPHKEHKTHSKRVARKSTILDSILGVSEKKSEKKESVEKAQKTQVQSEKSKKIESESSIVSSTQISTSSSVVVHSEKTIEKKVEEKREIEVKPVSESSKESSEIMREIKNTIALEVESNPHNEEILNTILTYLSKYWSVGELRLRMDISKMLAPKLGLKEEDIFERVGKILKILRRFNVIEIVEPGVVNLLRRDIQVEPSKIKLLEVLGS